MYSVKTQIRKTESILVRDQKLLFRGQLLEDGKTLNEYAVKEYDLLELQIKGSGTSNTCDHTD